MILWIALFLLVVAISFVLALQSMRDYQEIPQETKEEYGLFLIRHPASFNAEVLNSLGNFMLANNLIISLERLFKGNQAALTIFGPKKILSHFLESLNLLELEDYVFGYASQDVAVWEMGTKNIAQNADNPNTFENISKLDQDDQFFWQLVLEAKKIKDNLVFQTQIRAMIYCKDPARRAALVPVFEKLPTGNLVKVPKPFSTEQILEFFKLRSLSKDSSGPVLDSAGILSLLKV